MPTNDKGILLEAGTNELEVLVFAVANQRFGVNVAKVREILPIPQISSTPDRSHAIEGLVRIRDLVVTMANLESYLFSDRGSGMALPVGEDDKLLLLEFNQDYLGFRVQSVERIYRISWKDVLPPPDLSCNGIPFTSVILLKDTIIPILDFESIGTDLGMPSFPPGHGSHETIAGKDRSSYPLVFADDSPLVRETIRDRLRAAGYTNLKIFSDGEAAWNYLSRIASDSSLEDVFTKVAGVITDIEMPRMDGLSLTKKIRQESLFKDLPVVLFSSIASDANANKAKQVGADAQLSKPESDRLSEVMTQLLDEAATRESLSA